MQKDKKFYQDFLFETISTDEQEYPAVELSYSTIEVPDIEISLTYLMSILTQPAWDKMIASTKNKKLSFMMMSQLRTRKYYPISCFI
ncbi:MAG: hypothetical protein SOZ65_02220 [Erysipelotrichaceae bacterium]|nr:hypothetical protein [Erysipelotrichaceae bacterium]